MRTPHPALRTVGLIKELKSAFCCWYIKCTDMYTMLKHLHRQKTITSSEEMLVMKQLHISECFFNGSSTHSGYVFSLLSAHISFVFTATAV